MSLITGLPDLSSSARPLETGFQLPSSPSGVDERNEWWRPQPEIPSSVVALSAPFSSLELTHEE